LLFFFYIKWANENKIATTYNKNGKTELCINSPKQHKRENKDSNAFDTKRYTEKVLGTRHLQTLTGRGHQLYLAGKGHLGVAAHWRREVHLLSDSGIDE
jgi:hypothetical protein